jgi:SAM-dependent methyltransferase
VTDFHVLAESRHELQNPTSPAKIRLLGERLGLDSASRVLDLASGRGGPAVILARAFGCSITGVEIREPFLEVARERGRRARLDCLLEFRLGDAREPPQGDFDVVMCLGATGIWGGLEPALAALSALAPTVVVGEPFWRALPLPDDYPERDGPFALLDETLARLEHAGLRPDPPIVSTEAEWDAYEHLHWETIEDWLAEHDDPEVRARHREQRERYERWRRAWMGWAIIVGRR